MRAVRVLSLSLALLLLAVVANVWTCPSHAMRGMDLDNEHSKPRLPLVFAVRVPTLRLQYLLFFPCAE
jgi:hypothetical protein